jgi:hypothetical protein
MPHADSQECADQPNNQTTKQPNNQTTKPHSMAAASIQAVLRLEAGGSVLASQEFDAGELPTAPAANGGTRLVPLQISFSARRDIPFDLEIAISTQGELVAESTAGDMYIRDVEFEALNSEM